MRFEECMRTSFPSWATSGHPLSPVRRREGRRPVLVAGPNQDLHSDADPRRSTPSRRPGCLPPLRPRQASARRIAPPNESCASVPRSRRAHFLHELWRVPSGHCKHQSAVTRDPWHSRYKRLCYRWDWFFRTCVPGTDDPSAPFGSTVVARLRELFALLVPTPDAAPRRLLRPRVRGPMCRELHERFMPDAVGPFKKKDRPQSLFLSTELSTGTSLTKAAFFTAPLVLRGQMARKTAAALRGVENNGI